MPLEGVKLVSMKRSKKKARSADRAVSFEPDPFPFGLRLHLDNESLTKLGIKDLPTVGGKMVVYAVAEVTEVSKRDGRNDSSRNVELQLQELQVEPKPAKKAATVVDRTERLASRRA